MNKKELTWVGVTGGVVAAGLVAWLKFVALPGAAGALFDIAKDEYNLDITVGDWAFDLSEFTISANDIAWTATGKYSNPNLFTADTVSAKLNKWTILSGNFDLLRATKKITVVDPTIVIEHKNGDRWNWQDAFSTRDVVRAISQSNVLGDEEGRDLSSDFSISKIHLDKLHIIWIEELEANSGDGRVQHLTSELHIDDAQVVINDIVGFTQKHDRPMSIDFDGRTADGIIKVSGEINPFSWATPDGNTQAVGSPTFQKVVWAPYADGLSVYLENVSASAIGSMVPDALLQPVSGKMRGEVLISWSKERVAIYDTDLEYQNVSWGINERSSVYKKAGMKSVKKALKSYSKSGVIKTSSRGSIGDADFRLIPSIQTAITREALSEAPKTIKKVAARDQIRYEDKKLSPAMTKLESTTKQLKQVTEAAKTANKAVRAVNSLKHSLGSLFR